jgi:VanZ family protein
MGLIFFLSAQPDLPNLGHDWLGWLFSSAAHAFVFGVLAVLWVRVLGRGRRVWFVAFVLAMLYALSDEFHQTFVPGRVADPWDLFCDALGATLALMAFARLWRERRAH